MSRAEKDSGVTSNWVATLGSDVTKIALGLYLLGTIASIIYYSRFSILTLDFIKAQAILVGCYVLGGYLAIPSGILWLMRRAQSNLLVICVLCGALASVDAALLFPVAGNEIVLLGALVTMVLVQVLAFIDGPSIIASLQQRALAVGFRLVPNMSQAAFAAVLACVHFALSIYPGIPMYFGGAKPMDVQIVTKTPDLAKTPLDPNAETKINDHLSSYSMTLLYETDKEMYFLTDVKGNDVLVEHIVSRIPRSEILRVRYQTPFWVKWR